MDLSRPVARIFLRIAAIPVAIFLFFMVPVLKDCIAKVRTPCAKMVEEDEVQQLTGIRVNEVSVVDRDDYCNADHWDYFQRRLMMVAVQKNGSGEYGASFAKQVKNLELGRGVVATEPIEGLDAEAALVEIRGDSHLQILLIDRPAQQGFIEIYLYLDSYKSAFTRDDAKKLVPLLKPRLALADAYLATRKAR